MHLRQRGIKDVVIVEAGDGVGGRVRTDVVDGFTLDRGFQIFLTGYPEAQVYGMRGHQCSRCSHNHRMQYVALMLWTAPHSTVISEILELTKFGRMVFTSEQCYSAYDQCLVFFSF
jgi:hypothetical protein